jgi:hypothetical protein
MLRVRQPLREQIRDYWLARGAIIVTALLNAFLITSVISAASGKV